MWSVTVAECLHISHDFLLDVLLFLLLSLFIGSFSVI